MAIDPVCKMDVDEKTAKFTTEHKGENSQRAGGDSVKRDVRVYIDDVLECIDKIEEYTEGVGEGEFYENTQIQDAVIRRLEIISEAIKSIPVDFKEQYLDIPWRKIAGMRDVLMHGYAGVNLLRVWRVAIDDLPDLKKRFQEIGGEAWLKS